MYAVDKSLHKLLKDIELLAYLNPNNIEQEKKRFFASKYTIEPVFTYTKPKFDAYKLQRKLFSHRLSLISDEAIRALYEEIIYYYSGMVQCIHTIGDGEKFYYNSFKVFGTPTDKDVDNARFILHFKDVTDPDAIKIHNAAAAQAYFESFSEHYNFPITILQSTRIASDAMVKNSEKTLLLKKNGHFSNNQLKILAHHEIGVHLLTSYNAAEQPLKIFSNGFPRNVETQEGLAVFSEYMAGALTLKRLKTLAYRVLAVDSLRKGYRFMETFKLLHFDYQLNKDDAFTISMRVHRGGGFTKDYLYLTGLQKIFNHYNEGNSLDTLLTGKVTLQHKAVIESMMTQGIVVPSLHKNMAYKTNSNTNTTVDFILKNLR
ncbi:hypothetical protein W5A_11686 [Imtechella halotolerans K1]|uniref:DUF1704 domain-containing protein n=1 Tax=Imtechella halotolerans K1 TaxID=946077 RepID=I0W6Z7_9FLAO|nr:hypothetical protein W5A_11686 [Imtechella halotolerans K1]